MFKTRKQRREEAIERDLARDNRTTDEQLHRLRQRPGKSAKETARLSTGSPSEADMRDALIFPDDEFLDDEEELDMCELGEHEFELVLYADGRVEEECVRCGAIDA